MSVSLPEPLPVTETTRPQPFLFADAPALDLLNSTATPWGTTIDWLSNGRDLLSWLAQADLLPTEESERLLKEMPPAALDAVAAHARELREWFRDFVATHAGRPLAAPASADLDKINRLLQRDATYRQIVTADDATSLHWQRHRRWRAPEDLLLPLAEAMADLICQTDFTRVRNCEGPTCTMWFNDVSKNHTRRWCSMAICGNRAKAAAHRAKKRAAQAAQ